MEIGTDSVVSLGDKNCGGGGVQLNCPDEKAD
jgi:hypothetical protein